MFGAFFPSCRLTTEPTPSRSPSNAESSICSSQNIPRTREAENAIRGCRNPYEPNTIEWERFLQRLFSTFPNSWPGLGLLLLRGCLGIALICSGTGGLAGGPQDSISLAPYLIADIGGLFMLVGLWTPVIGTVVALDEVWIAL